MKYLSIICILLAGCIMVEKPNTYDHSGSAPYVEVIYEYPCSDVEPYNYNAAWCDSGWDYICCTWYIGWGCREEWCLWDDSCGWEYIDDYCTY